MIIQLIKRISSFSIILIVLCFSGCEMDSGDSGASKNDSKNESEILYSEDFESTVSGWYYNSSIYTPALSSPGANGTNACLIISGGNSTITDVIYTDIGSDIQPTLISFYALSGSTTDDDAIFSVVDSNDYFVFMCWFDLNGYITVRNSTGSQQVTSYTAATWYNIEYRNIDWNSHTYDFYVNGTLRISNVTFWQNSDNIRYIQFGNFHNSVSALDEIVMQ